MLKRLFIVSVLLLAPGILYGAEKFGMLFDIQGNAELKTAKGDSVALSKSKHLLKPVADGDRIEVRDGKVLIVSLDDKQGYEVQQNSTVQIEGNKLKTLKGTVAVKEGFRIPASGASGPIGAIVLRSTATETCINTVSPVNTAVLTTTPELRWKISCRGAGTSVSIRVLLERQVVFEAATEGGSLRLPEGVLAYGQTYRWLVDGGPYGIVGGTFSIPEKTEAARISEKIDLYKQQGGDIPQRLSYVFFLTSNRLNDMADAEVEKLKKEFPDNDYIKELR